jgi:hypothetical protein
MPCLYFEPQHIAVSGQDIGGRLPLWDEYDGCCHARGKPQPVLPEIRFSGCNHGHFDKGCTALPLGEGRRNRRFHLQGKTQIDSPVLDILILEIEDHTPVRSHSLRYSRVDERLEPEPVDRCERAQVLAFCRSYLRRFSQHD